MLKEFCKVDYKYCFFPAGEADMFEPMLECQLYRFIGGLLMVPQKHKEASKFKYNSGFFITTNVYPDFGHEHDCEAIKRRLAVFQTKQLSNKDKHVSSK